MPLTARPTSSPAPAATDEKIACYCPYCPTSANLLLTCRNAWSQISNSYFLNVIERDNLSDAPGIKSADNRLGSGQLAGCQLETLRCRRCTYLVGTRCLEAPPDKSEFQGCYLFKLKFFMLKLAATGEQVEPYVISGAQPKTPDQGTPSLTQPTQRESTGPVMYHGLTSRPASAVPADIASSKTLSNDSSSGAPSHQASTSTRDQLTQFEELSDTVRQVQAETLYLRQIITDMQRSQLRLPTKSLVESQNSEIYGLKCEVQVLRDRVAALERAKAEPRSMLTSQTAPRVNGQKRSFSQSNGGDDSQARNGLPLKPESASARSHSYSRDRDVGMKDAETSDGTPTGDDDLSDMGADAATSELASRHMVPSSILESEVVVFGDANTASALEDLGPGEVNGGWGVVTKSEPVFAKPPLPWKREVIPGESQISEYIPSGGSTATTASHDIRPASFVPLNRNYPYLDGSRERPFNTPVAIEGWDNSQDTDYRPSGEAGSARVTPDSARFRGQGRGRGSGSRGDREAIKFKNYSARLTEPAPWESEDWDGTTGASLMRSPSSRGRTVRQRGQSSTSRTLEFDTPEGARKKSRLVSSGPRPRDEAGRLLRANGMVDRRSERYRRKKTVDPRPTSNPAILPHNNQVAAGYSYEMAPFAVASMGGGSLATPVRHDQTAAAPATAAAPTNHDQAPAPPAFLAHSHAAPPSAFATQEAAEPLSTPAKDQTAVSMTDSPKTHEDFMRRIYPKGRRVEQPVDDDMALR